MLYYSLMSSRVPDGQRLESQALEERTHAIGRELFAAATRQHAHLSILNRWTAQVLSWCLTDAAVKSAVLRFIDVLPSLSTPQEVAQHVREYFPSQALRLPAALRLGSELAKPGLLTQRALATLVHQLVEHVGHQFIAQSRSEGVSRVVGALAARGATCSLDALGEQVLSEPEADRYVAQCHTVLRDMVGAYRTTTASTVVTCGPRANLSVKPSALTPRFDPVSPAQSLARAVKRLLPLLQLASQHTALINLDMEQYELCDLTLALAKQLLVHPYGPTHAGLGVVIQAYLRDSDVVVDELLAWLATHERSLTVRLVKGAYWDSETALAQRNHWSVPVYADKAETDLAFERLTVRLLGAFPLVTTAIASHNVRSIAHAMATAELLGLSKDQLEFQLLYGMGDALLAAIVERGYPVRIYTPIGELIPGMAYLVRRILENTANESFLRQDFFHERTADVLLRPPIPPSAPSVRPISSVGESTPWVGEPLGNFARADARERMIHALSTVRGSLGRHYPLLLGDAAPSPGAVLTARNPASPEEVLGTVACAARHDVDEAVRVATAAQPQWARRSTSERVACLRRAAQLIRERRELLAAWTVIEVGKTWREADVEIIEAIEYLDYYSEQMLELERGKPLLQLPGERNQYQYQPRGVAAVIAPWNFPAAILMGMTAAALVSGNAVILKPAEQSSIIAAHLAQILREAGVPSGVLQFFSGVGEEVGAALVAHPGVHAILFTGSKAVGLSIIEAAARVAAGQRFVKHVVTEMGGKNAIIVDADADLDAALQGILHSAFSYAGQKCSAASRLIVHASVYDRLLPRLIAAVDRLMLGDPSDPRTDIGPLIDAEAKQRLLAAHEHASAVATIAYRYPSAQLPGRGHFVGPTIVTDVSRQDRLATEELFGPLLCVFRAKTFEEGLTLANDTDYALTGGVYSRSPAHLECAMQTFDVGNLYLNRPITGAMVGRQPFGGHRLSGLGTKAGGPDYLLQLVIPKTIATNTTRHGTPLE